MGVITEQLIRKRAEHNEGLISTLEEVALHQQNIEKIELIGQLCPKLKILYLQNNLISKIQNLHKLKELQYLNLAVNNITKLQNLQRCESLTKLDLTVNFISKAGLLSICSLQANEGLRELHLLGNPCTDWGGYRQYVIAQLPQLTKLDGQDIKRSERIAAQQVVRQLEEELRAELWAEGVDPDKAAEVEDDSMYEPGAEVAETGYIDEKGELVRPWCPATRILEHREMEQANREAEERKAASSTTPSSEAPAKPPRLDDFPEIKEGERVFQKNEGKWDFTLDESQDGSSVVLDVQVGKYLDTSLIKADVQPTFVRLLIKGRLLQLLLPCEVRPDAATAQRSTLTGTLQITMPKERPGEKLVDPAHMRPVNGEPAAARQTTGKGSVTSLSGAGANGTGAKQTASSLKTKGKDEFIIREVQKAVVHAAEVDDDDFIPDL
mmetsp:Transcript_29508/g.65337  ORF Transcript_29508/g.65337 Transcript_29508/m.65337 type:complete len:438 (+) Transcript_29508:154-1467(+)|eukprot:CAMPEP_0202902458 /NCGR_PEP_ID=MMETSP1392-20130828/16862_1 /ASSEMBLY_ACC=CAM_ASM_000868 /TAXON_ID=225041 /ORGANISM="Chlamydomonas chlamydogama, Strain SAG 11-48b" /LENGTH=437 /DNA_ID=CAMNT_0049589221 /DNA_START=97 /DNA_END=1410 /DNA_ORIENTATION=+